MKEEEVEVEKKSSRCVNKRKPKKKTIFCLSRHPIPVSVSSSPSENKPQLFKNLSHTFSLLYLYIHLYDVYINIWWISNINQKKNEEDSLSFCLKQGDGSSSSLKKKKQQPSISGLDECYRI